MTGDQGRSAPAVGQPEDDRISPAQRRAIFAAGRARGLGIEDLRALTPQHSISHLTHRQAAALLNSLNRGTPHDRQAALPARRAGPRRRRGIYAFLTIAQRNMIRYFVLRWGWSERRFADWLGERHFRDGRKMVDMRSTADGVEVIELLKAVDARMQAAAHRRAAPPAVGRGIAACQMPRGNEGWVSDPVHAQRSASSAATP